MAAGIAGTTTTEAVVTATKTATTGGMTGWIGGTPGTITAGMISAARTEVTALLGWDPRCEQLGEGSVLTRGVSAPSQVPPRGRS